MNTQTLADVLESLTAEGELYERLDDNAVRCFACGHRCLIKEGRHGICHVRYNEGGRLRVPWGYVGGVACDPTEKKPFNHILPGSTTLTFGMLGCDFHCSFCQNWVTSQTLRDTDAGTAPQICTPEQLISIGRRCGAQLVASSYNEPLITSEWARAVFAEARRQGLRCMYVSNGNLTREVLDYIRPYLIGYKIDLKAMNDKAYRQMGGVLQNVLDGIRLVHASGLWLEIVTLLIPGVNDDPGELRAAAEFLAALSPDIPWHVTAFHQDYKLRDPENTTARHLMRAAEIGRAAGLRYVYCGNLPGQVGPYENTVCPSCGETLVTRYGFHVLANKLEVPSGQAGGRCPRCRTTIAGIWA
jgi:pyruvate formate lyase activating enzyme